MSWNDEDILRLAALLRLRRYRVTDLATIMNRAPGQVSGMVWRHPLLKSIGLLPPLECTKRTLDRRARRERIIEMNGGKLDYGTRVLPKPRPLIRLESWCCRFPMWGHYDRPEPEEMLFCAQIKEADSSYCRKHKEMCRVKPRGMA